jgi:glutathione S-transferase
VVKITIYLANKNYSSWSLRPWLALKQTGAAFMEEVIPLDQPTTREQILRVSPSGKVPALHHGDVRVWESLAIAEYLAEAFPDAHLWPTDPAARALARSISAEMHGGFMPLRHAMPMNMRASAPGKGMAPGVQDDINRITAIWRSCREQFGKGGPFLFGTFTIADAMFAPVASRFTTYQTKLDEESEAYRQAILNHPPFQEWQATAKNEPWIVPKYEV